MAGESYEQHNARLERAYMNAIDDALDALDAYHAALASGDAAAAATARARARRAWATFGEIIINRADARTAHMLLDQMRQIDALFAGDEPTGSPV